MNQIIKLKDTFIQYLSPAAKRRRTVGPQTPSNDHGTHEPLYEPISEPRDGKAKAVIRTRVNKKYLSPSDTKKKTLVNSRKRRRDDDESEEAIMTDEDDISPEDSTSQLATDGDDEEDEGDEAEDDEDEAEEVDASTDEDEQDSDGGSVDVGEEDEMSAEAKVQDYLARQAEQLALKRDEVEKVKAQGGWHPDEIFLFERLAMRSFEPLLHDSWQIDFPTLPEVLFTSNEDDAFINHHACSIGRGVHALQSLTTLCRRVKEKIHAKRPTEQLISKEIKNFMKWSERDGGYYSKRFIPVLAVVTARSTDGASSLSKSITDQLQFLGEKHREALAVPGKAGIYSRTPPILYGIIVAQTITLFVTLDSANAHAKARTLAHFDFKEEKMDVWNGLALAIIVIVARNYMMSVKDELEDDEESSSDPDA